MTAYREGVIRFQAEHRREPLPKELWARLGPLVSWRRVLRGLGLVGQDPERYDGYGYGNLSLKVEEEPGGMTSSAGPRLLITASQTSGETEVSLDHFALIEGYDLSANRVMSRGRRPPSSESLSHAAAYELSSRIGAVFHVHSPDLWGWALDLPTTDPAVEAGTPEMGLEFRRLWDEGALAESGVVVMGGHEDGILTFGADADEAGHRLLATLKRTE